jgi:hypothetical protein
MLDLMCDLVLDKYDADRDGRLSANEWARLIEFEPAVLAFARKVAAWVAEPLSNLRAAKGGGGGSPVNK